MSSNIVRLCGRRGLMAWCHSCVDWEPFTTGPSGCSHCRVCRKPMPEVYSYADSAPPTRTWKQQAEVQPEAPEREPTWWLYTEYDEAGVVRSAATPEDTLRDALAAGWCPTGEVFAYRLVDMEILGCYRDGELFLDGAVGPETPSKEWCCTVCGSLIPDDMVSVANADGSGRRHVIGSPNCHPGSPQ